MRLGKETGRHNSWAFFGAHLWTCVTLLTARKAELVSTELRL